MRKWVPLVSILLLLRQRDDSTRYKMLCGGSAKYLLSALSVLLGRNGSYTDMIQGVSILSMIPGAAAADL